MLEKCLNLTLKNVYEPWCQYIYLIVIVLFFQIPIATSGIRGMGFLMRHQLRTEGLSVSQRMITQLVKVKQELFDSSDI